MTLATAPVNSNEMVPGQRLRDGVVDSSSIWHDGVVVVKMLCNYSTYCNSTVELLHSCRTASFGYTKENVSNTSLVAIDNDGSVGTGP